MMKGYKKFIALATAIAMMSSTFVNAQDSTYTGGNGYQQYSEAPRIGAAVVLGAIAIAAIVAVAVQNSNNSHGHCH